MTTCMGKMLLNWLSLVLSVQVSFVMSFFLRSVLDETWDLIESVSDGFPTYSFLGFRVCLKGKHG